MPRSIPYPTPTPPPPGGRVCVIGAGVTGALTAVFLREAGFRVLLIEKAQPGNGSSSRSAAAMRAQFSTRDNILGMMYAVDWYANAFDHLQVPDADRGSSLVSQTGYLFLLEEPELAPQWSPERTAREKVIETYTRNVALQRELGLPVEMLTPEQLALQFPWLRDESWKYRAATYCPTDGFLDPSLIYTTALARAKELGVEVFTGTEVVGSRLQRGLITGLITADGNTIDCDAVVNATNAWGDRVSRLIGGSALPIEPVKRYLYFQNRPDGLDPKEWQQMPFTIFGVTGDALVYTRPDGPDQLMIGRAHQATPEHEFDDGDQDRFDDGFRHDDRSGGETYGLRLQQMVAEHAPILTGGMQVEHTTCGFYGDTPDHNPLIGFDRLRPNLLHAVGFSGHGVMHGPLTARLVQAMLSGDVLAPAEDGYGFVKTPWDVRPEEERRVRLLWGAHDATVSLNTFAVDREFSHAEGNVL